MLFTYAMHQRVIPTPTMYRSLVLLDKEPYQDAIAKFVNHMKGYQMPLCGTKLV